MVKDDKTKKEKKQTRNAKKHLANSNCIYITLLLSSNMKQLKLYTRLIHFIWRTIIYKNIIFINEKFNRRHLHRVKCYNKSATDASNYKQSDNWIRKICNSTKKLHEFEKDHNSKWFKSMMKTKKNNN